MVKFGPLAILTFVLCIFHEFVPPEVSIGLPEILNDLVELGFGDGAVVGSNSWSVADDDLGLDLLIQS